MRKKRLLGRFIIRPIPLILIWGSIIIFFLCGCGTTTSTTTTTTSTTTTTLPGAYIGAFVNGLANTPAFESQIGRNLAVNMFYIDWNTNFPSADCDAINSYGGIPHIVWEPWLVTTNTLDAISSGSYDTYIGNFAQAAKNWGGLIYLRFAHEMNGNWYPWDGTHNGGSAGPVKYIAAWQHIRNIFTNAGATNVKFVWSPNHISYPTTAWNDAVNYYPGAAYVDWIGLDGYNWGAGNWQSFSQIFDSYYATFSSYGKPIMISEFACTTDEAGSTKAAWLTDAFTNIQNNYPKIRMFNWFNINKERDWRIDSSAGSQTAFKNAVSGPSFLDSKPDF